MDPVTREKLASNAFRTLGLSGSAGQSAIEATARKMRIWPDASRVPPTVWDFPLLGPIRRSKPEIEQAVSVLNQPVTRLEHRLLWFGLDQPPPGGIGDASLIAQRHAAAIVGLGGAWMDVRPDNDGTRWSPVVKQIVRVCESDELAKWIAEVEQAGHFDKPTSDQEIASAVRELPTAVAAGLVRQAMSALDDGRLEAMVAIASAIRQVPASADGAMADLLNRTEDLFNARSDALENEFRPKLRINWQDPQPWYAANAQHTAVAAEAYDNKVLPAMTALMNLTTAEPDRLMRVKSRCGELLVLLALGLEWSGQFVFSEQQLQEALRISAGTVAELQVRKELQRIAPLAEQERNRPVGQRPLSSGFA